MLINQQHKILISELGEEKWLPAVRDNAIHPDVIVCCIFIGSLCHMTSMQAPDWLQHLACGSLCHVTSMQAPDWLQHLAACQIIDACCIDS